MKFYRGSGRAARAYVEADHHRADDYYLAEGTGVAELVVVAGPAGTVAGRADLTGEDYQEWVEGRDVLTEGHPEKGVIRHSEHALRFAEVIVNGPKSWSLAAGLHSEISVAYDRAQNAACDDIARYLSANVSTRVGRRGEQRQVQADRVEVARIRHYTSRAGDPHRHIHLQVNARVWAGGKWRGIDSAAMLRMQRAINGIGHRSVATNPEFRQTLAAHGYTLNAVTGEIDQLAEVVLAMSKRTTQVAANIARYETQWHRDHPDLQPSHAVLRSWDTRAWADAREAKKNHPTRGVDAELGWMIELARLGVDVDAHRAAQPAALNPTLPGQVDRDEAASRVVRVLSAGVRGRSTWNDYDLRGVAEEVLAGRDVVADRAVLDELAEDIAARAKAACLTVVDTPVPAHIRHWTSQEVIDLEAEIRGRLAVRAAVDSAPAIIDQVAAALAVADSDVQLDAAQLDGVRAVVGTRPVVLIEGAAGTGKSTMLAAANTVITAAGQQMMVVAPSRNAALLVAEKIGAGNAPAAAGLAFEHGFRWDTDGVWSRLKVGQRCPLTGNPYAGPQASAVLRTGDVLVVDEAGMLNQETARALLRIADESCARIVFMGDRRQLPAVGRGGVLSMVAQWTPDPVELAAVHRFRTPDGGRDSVYADLTLRIRTGHEPEAVFDELLKRGHVRLHRSDADALAALAVETADRHISGETQSVSLGTNDAVDAVNQVVRERLVAAGVVDNAVTVNGSDGLPIGAGDQVVTRKNDAQRGIANRMTWTAHTVTDDGAVTLTHPDRAQVTVPAGYVREHLHLAYATTGHGVQGQTSRHGRLRLTDTTDAAALYVGMTRGQRTNQVHIVADSPGQAREQWVTAAGRDRGDLGLDQARKTAVADAQNFGAGLDGETVERDGFTDRLSRVNTRIGRRPGDEKPADRPRTFQRGGTERERNAPVRRPEPDRHSDLDRRQPDRVRGPRL